MNNQDGEMPLWMAVVMWLVLAPAVVIAAVLYLSKVL